MSDQPLASGTKRPSPESAIGSLPSFEEIWEHSIMPLVGKRLYYDSGSNMVVLNVTWSGIKRRSSLSRNSEIPIEVFLWAVEQLRMRGRVTRVAINDHFNGRYSSAVTLVLAQLPELELLRDPLTLVVRRKGPMSDG